MEWLVMVGKGIVGEDRQGCWRGLRVRGKDVEKAREFVRPAIRHPRTPALSASIEETAADVRSQAPFRTFTSVALTARTRHRRRKVR